MEITVNGQHYATPVGVRGLKQYSGQIQEEFHRALRTPSQRYALYQEMGSNHPLIGVSLEVFKLLMGQVDWMVVPATDDLEGQRDADFAYSVLFDDMRMPWREVLRAMLSALQYGWASLAIAYKYRRGMQESPYETSVFTDGALGLDSLELRAQNSLDRWEFDERGRATGWHQLDPAGGDRYWLPMEALAHVVTDPAKGNPEGTSMLRHCVPTYWNLRRWVELLGIGISRDVAGVPVAEIPAEIIAQKETNSTYQTVYQGWQNFVRNLRRGEDEGGVLPYYVDENGHPLSKFSLLASSGPRQFDILGIIKYYEQQLLIALFTDILLVGHEQVGSLALHSSKTSFLSMALGGILNLITQVMNTQVLSRLWRLNGWQRPAPRLNHGDVESVDLTELGTFIAQVSGAGLDVFQFEEEVWRRAGFQGQGGAG